MSHQESKALFQGPSNEQWLAAHTEWEQHKTLLPQIESKEPTSAAFYDGPNFSYWNLAALTPTGKNTWSLVATAHEPPQNSKKPDPYFLGSGGCGKVRVGFLYQPQEAAKTVAVKFGGCPIGMSEIAHFVHTYPEFIAQCEMLAASSLQNCLGWGCYEWSVTRKFTRTIAVQPYNPGADLFKIMYEKEDKDTRKLLNLIYRHPKLVGYLIVSALKDLHSKGIIHCDLKLENIMLSLVNEILSAEFIDLETSLETKNGSPIERRKPIGTRGFRAPESANEIGKISKYSFKSDYYGLGVVLLMLCCAEGFDGFAMELANSIYRTKYNDDRIFNIVKKFVSENSEAKSLNSAILALLQYDCSKRPENLDHLQELLHNHLTDEEKAYLGNLQLETKQPVEEKEFKRAATPTTKTNSELNFALLERAIEAIRFYDEFNETDTLAIRHEKQDGCDVIVIMHNGNEFKTVTKDEWRSAYCQDKHGNATFDTLLPVLTMQSGAVEVKDGEASPPTSPMGSPKSQPASPKTTEGGRGTTDEDTAASETKKESEEKKPGFWARQKQRWNGWNRWQKGFAIFGLVAAVAAVAATAYFTLAAAGAITVAAVIAHALPCSTGVAAAGSAGATGYGICLFGAASKTNSGARPPIPKYT